MGLKGYITTGEAAARLGVTDRHVRLLLTKDGSVIEGTQVGRNWLVLEKSLEKFSRHPTKGRPKSKQK